MSRRALVRLAAAAAVVGCVDIATGPGGINSIRLDTRARAIIAGDTLRDSTGAVTPLHVTAFDEDGKPVSDASFRFIALPTRSGTDTTTVAPRIVVDSTRGIVRALAPRTTDVARVAINVGSKLQLIDTLRIVLRPTLLTRTAPDSTGQASRLAFSCDEAVSTRPQSIPSDTIRGLLPESTYVGNYLALSTKLTADSSGTAVPVPGYFVEYRIVSPPAESIPSVTLADGTTRPALSVIRDAQSDRSSPYDTTDASGTSAVALRVIARPLGASALFTATSPVRRVVVRAQARRSTTDTLRSVDLVVRLRRVFSLTNTTATSCPAS